MKLGYACINWGLCKPKTFRLQSFSEQRFHETVKHNIECLKKTVEWNAKNGFLFFRISSDLIPFASHPINNIEWWNIYSDQLKEIGLFIKKKDMRISMHPDQFVVINSLREDVVEKSFKDLEWHCRLLDIMGLDSSAKIQIHVGGVYGDKKSAMERFVNNYKRLPANIKRRLAIENDEISYSLKDVLTLRENLSKYSNIPIIFDVFHHQILNNGESLNQALDVVSKTWTKEDGVLMIDYSTGETRKHDESININKFRNFTTTIKNKNFDIMLEIKDKEKSALKALEVIKR